MDPVTHFEIPVDDRERSTRFYEKTFGWKSIHMPEMKYVMLHTAPTTKDGMIKKKGAINGGIFHRSGDGKHPMVVIQVKSIAETVKKVEKNGGKLSMKKKAVGDMGFYARVKDTEGNAVGIWEDK